MRSLSSCYFFPSPIEFNLNVLSSIDLYDVNQNVSINFPEIDLLNSCKIISMYTNVK